MKQVGSSVAGGRAAGAVPIFSSAGKLAVAGGEEAGILRLAHYREETRGLPSVSTILRYIKGQGQRRGIG
jgi:hypothetical protein